MSADRRQRVVEYLLGEMDEASTTSFEADLGSDTELARMVEEMGPVVKRLETLPEGAWESPEPPPLVMPGSPPAIEPNTPAPGRATRRTGFGWIRAGVGMAAALVILVAGVLIGTQLDGSDVDTSGEPGQTLALDSLGEAPAGASGKVVLASSTEEAVTLDVSGLKPTDGGEFYELWLLGSEGELVALGSFRVEPDGDSEIEVPLPVNPGDYEYFDVSIQPDNGDPDHSGRSVLRGSTSRA
ncbi:MAG: anti-sigma factor [Solirubrobacterales bacterium]